MTRWTSRLGQAIALAAAIAALGPASAARADGAAFIHIVRPGETLASIAQRYYGDPRRESVLVAENGLTTQGGARIVVGLRLVIPWVSYHRVQEGESWAQIATQHYGDPRRAQALMDANPQVSSSQPDEGAELLVPYPLRHVARQGDTIRRVASLYYEQRGVGQRLMRFNGLRSRRLSRGQVVLVPISDLELSAEGRELVAAARGTPVLGGEVRAQQIAINEELPVLREHVRRGRYTEAVALGNRLLGQGNLTAIHRVTIQRELAVAYVALDRDDLALAAFRSALSRQPDLELDRARTSPRVLAIVERAREANPPPPPPRTGPSRGRRRPRRRTPVHPEAEAEGTPVESRALFQAWPSLRGAVPWVPLGRFPTPVTPLDGVAASLGRPGAALYAKRDDLSSPVYGGNKVRTLEALFGRALAAGARRIVATGAYGSNHAAATALHAPRAGLEAGAMLWPQAFSAAAEENLRVVISHVAWLRSLPHWSVFPFALAARRRAGSDHVMVPGGAVPAGGLGYVSAGLELAHQVRAGALPAPATLVLAVGSTCTTAGLLVGLEAAAELGLLPQPPRVLAVRVTPWPITASWRIVSLGVRIAELLASLTGDPRLAFDRRRLGARLTVDGRYLGPGYGAPTDAGRAAIQRFLANGAFRLDTTYSAKAAAALCDRIEAGLDRGPVLYWATKSTAPLPAPSREAWKDGPRRMVRWLDRGPR